MFPCIVDINSGILSMKLYIVFYAQKNYFSIPNKGSASKKKDKDKSGLNIKFLTDFYRENFSRPS